MPEHRGIIGDQDFGTELPMMQVDETEMAVEKNMAKFSRTKEFKALREHLEQRISYYQMFLPDGKIVGTGVAGTKIPTPEEWTIANVIISEFKAIIATYESASQAVRDASDK